MNPIVVLTNFERYLEGEKLEPIRTVEFKEVPIHDITQYVDRLENDRFLNKHGQKDGAHLTIDSEELSLKINSAYLEFVDGKIPLFLDIGHARNENGTYVLDKVFQGENPLLTENQKIIGYSMASLMYHYAISLQKKIDLPN